MHRNLLLTFILCFVATTGFAQSGFSGKWATDRPADPADTFQRRQSVQMELDVDAAKASGTVSIGGLGGFFEVLKDGRVSGNKLQFKTSPPADPASATTWTLEIVDDNTLLFRRSLEISLLPGNVRDLIAALPAVAQPARPNPPAEGATATTPSISGRVEDASHALIPGVNITAANIQTGAVTSTMTNESGAYSFARLSVGTYKVSASGPGFQSQTVTDLQVDPSSSLRSNFVLQLRPETTCLQSGACTVLHRVR